MFALAQLEEFDEPVKPSNDHWPQYLRTFCQCDDRPLVISSIPFLQSFKRVEFPAMYVELHNAP